MVRAEAGDQLIGVVLEELEGVSLVDLHAGVEDVGIHVVGPLFDEGAPLEALDELLNLLDLEDDDLLDLEVAVEEVGLSEGAGDAVEEEELLGGEVAIGGDEAVDVVVPDLDGHLVGEEEAFACVVVVELAGRRFGGEAAEDVPRGEVEVVPSAAEELAEGPFPRSRGPKDQDRAKRLSVFWNYIFLFKRHRTQVY